MAEFVISKDTRGPLLLIRTNRVKITCIRNDGWLVQEEGFIYDS
jgi:hypothetical protein